MPLPKGLYYSPASASLPNTFHTPTSWADYYAVLGLDLWATSDEIKEAFRQRRKGLFLTDASKYRELQAAYGCLVDVQARYEYDVVYRQQKGLPPPPVPEMLRKPVKKQGVRMEGPAKVMASEVLSTRKEAIIRAATDGLEENECCTDPSIKQESQEEQKQREAEPVAVEEQTRTDPNSALKRFIQKQKQATPQSSGVPTPVRPEKKQEKKIPRVSGIRPPSSSLRRSSLHRY